MKIQPASALQGEIRLPGDKSISHRYAILGAMAEGVTEISNFSTSLDCKATLQCLKQLGLKIGEAGAGVQIRSRGWKAFAPPSDILQARNSGTTIRLLSPLLAASPFVSVIQGDASLNQRPMKRIIVPLTRMGASIQAGSGGCPPLTIKGTHLEGIRYQLPVASAQVKSCILLAGLMAHGETILIDPIPSRDHTERALPFFGVLLKKGDYQFVVRETDLFATSMKIPGDFSAAAYFIIAGLIVPTADLKLRGVGINPSRTGLLRLLQQSGARLELSGLRKFNAEPVGDLRVRFDEEVFKRFPGEIRAQWIPNLIDEIPILAILGTRLRKGLTVRDAGELRKKESDRIHSITLNLRNLGVQIDELPDGFHIPPGQRIRGGRVQTFGDHRIAMAFAVAGLISDKPIELDQPRCVAVSFPGFFQQLHTLSVRKRHIYLVGFMGSGKSTIGPLLARRLGLTFHDLDSLIEKEQGLLISEIFEVEGEAFFRKLETRHLSQIQKRPAAVIALGGGAYLSQSNRDLISKTGIAVWLKIPLPLAIERCRSKSDRPLAHNPEQFRSLFHSRQTSYQAADLHVEVDGKSPPQISRKIEELVHRGDERSFGDGMD